MSIKIHGHELLNVLCDSLGLPKTVCAMTLIVKVNEPVRVIVEHFATPEQTMVIGKVVEHAEYELVEKKRELTGR